MVNRKVMPISGCVFSTKAVSRNTPSAARLPGKPGVRRHSGDQPGGDDNEARAQKFARLDGQARQRDPATRAVHSTPCTRVKRGEQEKQNAQPESRQLDLPQRQHRHAQHRSAPPIARNTICLMIAMVCGSGCASTGRARRQRQHVADADQQARAPTASSGRQSTTSGRARNYRRGTKRASGRPPCASAAKRSPRCSKSCELVEAAAGRGEQNHPSAAGLRAARKPRARRRPACPPSRAGRRVRQRGGESRRIVADQKRLRDAREQRREVLDAAGLADAAGDPDETLIAAQAREAASALVALLSLTKRSRRLAATCWRCARPGKVLIPAATRRAPRPAPGPSPWRRRRSARYAAPGSAVPAALRTLGRKSLDDPGRLPLRSHAAIAREAASSTPTTAGSPASWRAKIARLAAT